MVWSQYIQLHGLVPVYIAPWSGSNIPPLVWSYLTSKVWSQYKQLHGLVPVYLYWSGLIIPPWSGPSIYIHGLVKVCLHWSGPIIPPWSGSVYMYINGLVQVCPHWLGPIIPPWSGSDIPSSMVWFKYTSTGLVLFILLVAKRISSRPQPATAEVPQLVYNILRKECKYFQRVSPLSKYFLHLQIYCEGIQIGLCRLPTLYIRVGLLG